MKPLFNMRAASPSFSLRLQPDFAELYERKRSGDGRRSARRHEAALSKLGKVEFGLPATSAALHDLIDVMFRQQDERLAELGVRGLFGPSERRFIHRLAELQDPIHPVLAPYHLTLDGEVLAVMLGGLHGNGYWALISSLGSGPSRKHSPGDIALRKAIEHCCHKGLTYFDFSPGDAIYKRSWADDEVENFVSLRGVNLRGIAWAAARALHLVLKRTVKNTPVLLGAYLSVRRLVFGRRPG